MNRNLSDRALLSVVSENVKEFVEKSEYSHNEIASKLGITTRQLLRYKNGESDPPATILYLLADLLDVDIKRMFMTFDEWIALIREEYQSSI